MPHAAVQVVPRATTDGGIYIECASGKASGDMSPFLCNGVCVTAVVYKTWHK